MRKINIEDLIQYFNTERLSFDESELRNEYALRGVIGLESYLIAVGINSLCLRNFTEASEIVSKFKTENKKFIKNVKENHKQYRMGLGLGTFRAPTFLNSLVETSAGSAFIGTEVTQIDNA